MGSFVFHSGLVLHFKNESTNKLKQMCLCQISLCLSVSLSHTSSDILCGVEPPFFSLILFFTILSSPVPPHSYVGSCSPNSTISTLLHFQFYDFISF